ncbi:MAG: hypothetical protein K0Q67_3403, partial [Cellvibrio sp.]|nr:hypothetical protein [Cellvibrio sp.]
FSVAGDAKLVSPATINTTAGYASALVEIGDSLAGIKLTANAENLPEAHLVFAQ